MTLRIERVLAVLWLDRVLTTSENSGFTAII